MLDKNPETRIGVSDIKVGLGQGLCPFLKEPILAHVCGVRVCGLRSQSFKVNARDTWAPLLVAVCMPMALTPPHLLGSAVAPLGD